MDLLASQRHWEELVELLEEAGVATLAGTSFGPEGEGFRYAMKGLDVGRVNIAACSLGGAAWALGEGYGEARDLEIELDAALARWEAEIKADAEKAKGVPKNINDILAVAPDKRNDKQKNDLAAHFRSIAPELADQRQRRIAGARQLHHRHRQQGNAA